MTKVLFIWKVRDELKYYVSKGLSSLDVELIFPQNANEEFYLEHAQDADIIVGWRPTQALLDSASKLKLFINPGAGVQHLLQMFGELQRKKDIVLVNGHGNAYFTAQHIVGLLLTLMNKIIPHHNWMVEGKWRLGDTDAKSIPLRDKHIGLLGYGNVNKRVHTFLSTFDVSFSILRKYWDKDEDYQYPTHFDKYSFSELHEFLKSTDILIIAIPLTSLTEGLIGEKELKLLGKEGLLVSAGRGAVIDEKNLYEALRDRTIAGAAIDVWYDYQPEPDKEERKFPTKFPFHELENVVLSPHRAASPFDYLRRWDEVIENINRFVRGEKKFLNEVNVEEGY